MLRNLTTREYVDGDMIIRVFLHLEPHKGPRIRSPGFGEVIMYRVGCGISNSGLRIGTAPWMGHRFEIRTNRYHIEHSIETWKDVSSEVVKELSQCQWESTLSRREPDMHRF